MMTAQQTTILPVGFNGARVSAGAEPDTAAARTIELGGCAPEPLMSYLKALGVFRLVAQQKDASARACWIGESFTLQSMLDQAALVDFFLAEYRPTPIVSPWNGGSGFYPKDGKEALTIIEGQDSPRFRVWQEVIESGRRILGDAERIYPAKAKERKPRILTECRKRFPDEALDWLDAVYTLTAGGAKYLPLLGSGGNDGRHEFSSNFMRNVVQALNLESVPSGPGGGQAGIQGSFLPALRPENAGAAVARSQILFSLFNEGAPELTPGLSPGSFHPGGAGDAPNGTVGYKRDAFTNPWDFVLMMEGALIFAGSAARRLSAAASTKASFPFTVDSAAAGYGTAVASEYGSGARAEFWAPLWDRPATFPEVRHLASEGRAQLGRKQAVNGSDFGRAVIGLGVERGVSQFRRYGFMRRKGDGYLAVPLGQFQTVARSSAETAQRANLLFDLDRWLDRLRRAARDKNAPASMTAAVRRIDGAIMEFCQRDRPRDLQETLVAVGHAHRTLARSGMSANVPPLAYLSNDWARYAADGSAEFRLARAVASIQPGWDQNHRMVVGSIRENLELVVIARDGPGLKWDPQSVSCVWSGGGDPLSDLLSVLERRCRDGSMKGLDYPPLIGFAPARLDDIVKFLEGKTDDRRIAALALPLSFIRYDRPAAGVTRGTETAPRLLPSSYATMKLALPAQEIVLDGFSEGEAKIDRSEIRLPSLLRAGRVQESYRVACRRLLVSGFRPLSELPGAPDRSAYGRRLAAALLFPIRESAGGVLAARALRRTDAAGSQTH